MSKCGADFGSLVATCSDHAAPPVNRIRCHYKEMFPLFPRLITIKLSDIQSYAPFVGGNILRGYHEQSSTFRKTHASARSQEFISHNVLSGISREVTKVTGATRELSWQHVAHVPYKCKQRTTCASCLGWETSQPLDIDGVCPGAVLDYPSVGLRLYKYNGHVTWASRLYIIVTQSSFHLKFLE